MATYKIIDIEQDMPIVAEALAILRQELKNGKSNRHAALKIIHGYGSSGKGGRLRTAIRKELDIATKEGRIQGYIRGEEFSIFHSPTLSLLSRCPDLRKDTDLERCNSGVTFVLFH